MAGYRRDILSGAVTCEEAVKDEIKNIGRYNKEFNAFITVFGEGEEGDGLAIKQARERDLSIRRRGNEDHLGPLFGVLFTVKDNIFVRGFKTTAGAGPFRNFVPNSNAQVVDTILEMGGILLGKTNLQEIALGATSTSSFFGPVHNSRDSSRISGGSSGGSAVSAALAKVPLVSLGSDTGGSIRIPAALCGVCGFKPSLGVFSTEGVFPLSATLDHVGLLTNNMSDMIIAYQALTPRKGSDKSKKPSRTNRKARLGVPKNYFSDEIEKTVSSAYWRTLEKLRSTGEYEFVEGVDFSDLPNAARARRVIQLREASWFYEEVIRTSELRKLMHADVLRLLDSGAKMGMLSYMHSNAVRTRFVHRMSSTFRSIDFLLTPTCLVVAPKLEDTIGNETGPIRTQLIRNTEPFNVSGSPALTVPANLADKTSLPVGIQVAGAFGDDHNVLEFGQRLWNSLY